MFTTKKRKLRRLIESFSPSLEANLIAELQSYVDHGEYALAIESLCDWIYEGDVAVDPDREAAIVKLSSVYGVDPGYHAFIGRTPPYPDLRK